MERLSGRSTIVAICPCLLFYSSISALLSTVVRMNYFALFIKNISLYALLNRLPG